MKRNLVAEVMAEQCVYGGLLATRYDVYDDLRRQIGPNGERIGTLMLDRLTWQCPAATPEEAARLRSLGLVWKKRP